MQSIAVNWSAFGWSLAGAFVFGIIYACVVRFLAVKKIQHQTPWLVVFGVGVTLLIAIPTFGAQMLSLLFLFFAASGLPMVIEYVLRTQAAEREDIEKAQKIAKELVQ
jgi:hypothetical protein